MKSVLLLLGLAACDHATPDAGDNAPAVPAANPVQQARDEFELLPGEYAAGTHVVSSPDGILPVGTTRSRLAEGDFIGRLRALFGPRDSDAYVLRHKKTGSVVTAYSGGSGPVYGGGPRYVGALPDPNAWAMHLDEATAGPLRAGAIARLDALLSMVPPADYSETRYSDDKPTVYRLGARGGHSFTEDLPAAEGMAYLVDQARTANQFGEDLSVLHYYLAHEGELAAHRPDALASLAHLAAVANQEPGTETRKDLLGEVRQIASALHVPPP